MNCHGLTRSGKSTSRPLLEVADIFRYCGEEFRKNHALSSEQLKVMNHIETCRTIALGGHLDTCDQCGFEVPSYNSCGDRHCPKCQALCQAKWIEQRKNRILPTHYFHVVFTLPEELRSLALCNRKIIFDMLFASSAQTLLELGNDKKHIGGLLGITSVLHTWSRTIDFHPHIHCIVTGGGLDQSGNHWLSAKPDFLIHCNVIRKLFRGKFLHALKQTYNNGYLEFAGGAFNLKCKSKFLALMDKLYNTDWVVYAKEPFGGPMHVFEYLGRYTHRVAISNQRLQRLDDNTVTFYTKNGKNITLPIQEFIRRFLMHILPKNYCKIRHYGLYSASNVNSKLAKAFLLFASIQNDGQTELQHHDNIGETYLEQMLAVTGTDLSICPHCGTGKMQRTFIKPGTTTFIRGP